MSRTSSNTKPKIQTTIRKQFAKHPEAIHRNWANEPCMQHATRSDTLFLFLVLPIFLPFLFLYWWSTCTHNVKTNCLLN